MVGKSISKRFPSAPARSVRTLSIKNSQSTYQTSYHQNPSKTIVVKNQEHILKIKNTFDATADFRPIRFIIDADAY